jgi:arylsulfatase A-like enzyme
MTFIPEGGKDGTVTGNVVPPVTVTDLPTTTATIATLLAPKGYTSAHFGKWHAGNTDPAAYGFALSDGPTANRGPANVDYPNPYEAYAMTERAIAFITQQAKSGTPFYLQVSHYNSRNELDASDSSIALATERLNGQRADVIGHAAALMDIDISVGQLLQSLEQLGLANTTYVVFSSDHGFQGANANLPLTQGKGTIWEGGIRVPLFVRGPGIEAGTLSTVRASGVDLVPTLAQLASIGSLPEGLEGGSLVDVWMHGGSGTVTRPLEEFVVHFPHYDKDPIGPSSAILLGDYKMIRVYEDSSLRLFDLSRDYAEQIDLALTLPEKATELDQRLTAYLSAIGAQLPGHL